ncbi:MAG: protein kinase [Candidatus Eisenbacteria bacterium]
MMLTPGTKLGPYEIVAPLGAGGMGEVYRARDTRLGRDVAIKALPEAFAQDPERLARFEREARLLASLSHPNVAGIHGLELVEGHRYLVLELVEGETLAARLSHGALALGDAVDVGRQIAAGVEAAHDAGVVHRDLKPGNIMLTPDGAVKVLDFGLAKGGAAHGASASDPSLSASPTMTHAMTSAGMILGTAAYMSPEQARGKNVDRRTDIWSFGCVMYECLTGRRAFEGETVSDMVARILEREPDWTALPQGTPLWLRALLKRCLTKDLKQRLQAMGEARIALERGDYGVAASTSPRPSMGWLAWAPWVIVAIVAGLWLARVSMPGTGTPRAEERRVEVGFPPGQQRNGFSHPALSPDGRQVAVIGLDSAGVSRVWVRSLAEFEYRALKGTEGTGLVFWSPDSRSLGYITGGSLNRVSLLDGAVQKLAGGANTQRGGDWGSNGNILYTPSTNASIWRVAATGGTPEQVTQLDTTIVDASHRFPVWLPDGKHFLFALWSNNARVLAEVGGIYLAAVDGKPPKRLSSDVGRFLVLPSGYLVVARNLALVAIPFDLRSFRLGTQIIPIAEHVEFGASSGMLGASASAHGDIAYVPPTDLPLTDMVWLDRSGRRGDPLGLRSRFNTITLSPDGSRVAASMSDAAGLDQLWTADLSRRTISRLTRDQNDSSSPVWSPDGQRIAFNNRDTGTEDLYIQLAAGTRPKERVWNAREVDADLSDWSADGRYLFFTGIPRAGSPQAQVWVADLGRDSVHALLHDDFSQEDARLSPDGRWLAYASDESGRFEIYVRAFADLERKWQVSAGGGIDPHWRSDSRELTFENGSGGDRALWSATVTPSADGIKVVEPQRLFQWPADVIGLTIAADHTRFLALVQPAATVQPPLRAILGWNRGRSK